MHVDKPLKCVWYVPWINPHHVVWTADWRMGDWLVHHRIHQLTEMEAGHPVQHTNSSYRGFKMGIGMPRQRQHEAMTVLKF